MSKVPPQMPPEAPSSAKVTVACKLPHGIVIRDFVARQEIEPVLGGGVRESKVYRPVGPKYRIKGPVVPTPFIRHVEVVGGYAITEGIPADVFARWIEHNKDAAYIRNNLIFGDERGAYVRDKAREYAAQDSGVEPLDVRLKTVNGRQMFADERITRAGADQVVDGALEPTAA